MESRPSPRASPPRSGVDLVPAASSPSAMTIQDSTVVPVPKLATESQDGGPPDGLSSPSPRSNSGPRHPPKDGVAESYDEVDDDWDTLMPPPPPPNFFGSSTSFDVAPGTFNVIRPRGRIDKPISGKPKPKPKARPASTPIPERLEEHSFPPLEGPTVHPDPTQRRGSISDPDISRSYLRKYIRGAYISLIAPSFVHDKSALWDLQRLENRLNVLQTWVWAANAALFAASAALLALSDVSRSVIAQSFVVLSGIFGLYGFVYSVFLAFHIGDSRAQFSTWFLVCPPLSRQSSECTTTQSPGSRKLDARISLRVILGRINHVIAAAHMDGLGCPQPCMLPHLTWHPNRNLRPSDPADQRTDRNRRPGRPRPQFHTQHLPTGNIYARDRVELLLRCHDPPPDS
ncbi:hypothetical protein DFH09DRAFT_288720 [Mycena vulgaris]|nr:hypothetical protein DFH09DRAFT_288720 [Mycena vulgaris]